MFFTKDAYEEFCREQYLRVFNYLIKRWKIKKEDAEDIAQQVFYDHIRAMDKWTHDTHDPEEAVKYLFAITKNHARKAWGKHYKIQGNESLNDSEDTESRGLLEKFFENHFEEEKRIEILQAIEQLEPVERDVILLTFFIGEKHAEICERYGWKAPANVTRVLKKAYKKLANLLEDNPITDQDKLP